MNEPDELREASFLILAALAAAPQHGYGVIRDVEASSGGRIELVASTVYSAMGRLVASGLVAEVSAEIVNGRYRRYYGLTDRGVDRLRTEIVRWRANTKHAASCLSARTISGAQADRSLV